MNLKLLFISVLLSSSAMTLAQRDTLNQIDDSGKKQGYWIFYGMSKPEKGYCQTCKIEEGYFVDGRKHGLWTKYDRKTNKVKLKGTYEYGRPNGKYWKYYSSGQIKEYGNISKGQQIDSLVKYEECGLKKMEKFYNDSKREQGYVIYYYNTCECPNSTTPSMSIRLKKDNGVTVDTLFRYYPSGCLKERVYYKNGTVQGKDSFEDKCSNSPLIANRDCIQEAKNIDRKSIKPSDKFDPDGFNNVYNEKGELWMEGEFKNGKLWNGKLYKYDSDGVLLKVEMWKNGSP